MHFNSLMQSYANCIEIYYYFHIKFNNIVIAKTRMEISEKANPVHQGL